MSLQIPGNAGCNFRTVYSNVTAVRPSTTAWGTNVTPGNNTKGTAVSLGVTATDACYAVAVSFSNSSTSGAIRNSLTSIMMDPAGGTTYTTELLPNLMSGCAGPYGGASPGQIFYYFPIYVPAGATLAAQAQANTTLTAFPVAIWLFSDPTNPESLVYGHRCEAIGAVTASSQGTASTAGTTSDGAWTSLGSSTQQNFWWQQGFQISNGTITALVYSAQLSADNNATTPKIITDDLIINTTSLEQIGYSNQSTFNRNMAPVASGTTIYTRTQASGTSVAHTTIAYGVG